MNGIILHLQNIKRMLLGLVVRLFVLGFVAGSLFVVGWYSPNTALGYISFRIWYAGWDSKPALESYDRHLLSSNQGYIPQLTDDFLVRRLISTQKKGEQSHILDFYVKRAGEQEGLRIAHVGMQYLPMLFEKLPDYEPQKQVRAWLLIEQIRQGRRMTQTQLASQLGTLFPESGYLYQKWVSARQNVSDQALALSDD